MPEICTVGYENTTLADVIRTLRNEGVALVIDIREAPISRKPGFSKKVFGASLEAEGISYVHVRALGTPKAGREAARRGDRATFAAIFRRHFESDEAQDALRDVLRMAGERRACLLCYEADHDKCHRAIVAAAMAARGFAVAPLTVHPAL